MISSSSNQKIKRLVNLGTKSKERNKENVFIVEGIRMFEEAPKELILEVYVSESFAIKNRVKEKYMGLTAEIVSDEVFKKISNTTTPQGIMAVVKQPSYNLEDIVNKENPLVLVLENIQDPGNLGTIFRTSEGAGVDGIIMSSDTVDVFNPKVTRSTMGSLFRMPFVYTKNIHEVIGNLKRKNITTYAAHLEGSEDYSKKDYKKSCAFLIGNEGNGLKKETADMADQYIKIPMEGKLESLNAAISTAILIYEVHRQRNI